MSNDAADEKAREEEYIDPKGYWIDPERNVRRMSGEQEVVLKAAEECSDLEWRYFFDGIRDCIPKMKA